MRKADYIVDIGPGAGINGGEVVAAGTPQDIMACERSITGAYMSGREVIELPSERRSGNGKYLQIKGAVKNNLKKINVDIPLGAFCVVTGVSGSGKSSLINEVLYPVLQNRLNGSAEKLVNCKEILGVEELDKVDRKSVV